jgi:DNA helicase-2/ATP-dependent DNA helicase PcrA
MYVIMANDNRFFDRKKLELGVNLNEVQRQAVLHTEGPLLLLASPGSGKTTTIIMRIGYLIEEKGADPSRIKAVTFSKASANDMKERFKRFFSELPSVDFSTIHSFAFQVTKEHFQRTGTAYRIIEGEVDRDAQAEGPPDALPLHKAFILRELFKSTTGEQATEDQLAELTTYISYIQNKMIPEEKWAQVACGVRDAERILRAYETFKRSRDGKRLIDFDDMLTIANRALTEDEALLRKYQRRYDYVLTDESQDTSLVQHAIVEKLVRAHNNLCVVADDDQSIYSWRGAEPSYLLDFKQAYPSAAILYMEQNYRSSKNIVDAANHFIKRNKNRFNKNMFTDNPAYRPIAWKGFSQDRDQAKYVVRELREVDNLRDVAVLYRNNTSSIPFINEFDRAGIPFYMKDADNRFFSHWVVQDVLNFMRMTFTDRRPDLLEKIHTKLSGYITKQQMAALKAAHRDESVFDTLLHAVPLQDYQVSLIQESQETFRQMKGMPPLAAIRVIRERLGYEKGIEKLCERFGFRKVVLVGILNTLEEIAEPLDSMESFAARIKHLEQILRNSKFQKDQNAVTLSTFHSSKGLEFERVYMIDLVDGVIPSDDDRTPEGMEEAVRLFYVGMTRAKRQLELLSYRERGGEKAIESPFVAAVRSIVEPPKPKPQPQREGKTQAIQKQGGGPAIPYNPNAIRSKDRLIVQEAVRHRVFGQGEIVELEGDTIVIRFSTGIRKLSVPMCVGMGLLEPV